MGLKINLKPPKWIRRLVTPPEPLRRLQINLNPHNIDVLIEDAVFAGKVLAGTASLRDFISVGLDIARQLKLLPTQGNVTPQGGNMQTPISWRKLTVTLITLIIAVVQLILTPSALTPQQAATSIAGLIITGLIGLAFVLTQGKVDIAKYTGSGLGADALAYLDKQLAAALTPVAAKVEELGSQLQGTAPTTVAPITVMIDPTTGQAQVVNTPPVPPAG